MQSLYLQLLVISRRLWRPWSADEREREAAEAIASAAFVLWLAGSSVVVWMAVGTPPDVLAGAAVAMIWVLGLIYVFGIQLPLLLLRWLLILRADSHSWLAHSEQSEPPDLQEARYEGAQTRLDALRRAGALPQDYELPPIRREDLPDYLDRTAALRPTMRLSARIAGAILIVALIAGAILIVALISGGQTLLATIYAVPSLAWIAIEWLRRTVLSGGAS